MPQSGAVGGHGWPEINVHRARRGREEKEGMSDSQALWAALGAGLVFFLVGLIGFTVRALVERLNRAAGTEVLDPNRRALRVIFPFCPLLVFVGFWLTTGPVVLGWAMTVGGMLSTFWLSYFRWKSRRALLD